jgi:O6-methylguanine-DNA--protein-cysteine methyltransferase
MLAYIAVPPGQDIPTGPTIDPPTYAHPTHAIHQARVTAMAVTDNPAAILAVVHADGENWTPVCPECLRAVGQNHTVSCPSMGGPVSILSAVLMHSDRVRA